MEKVEGMAETIGLSVVKFDVFGKVVNLTNEELGDLIMALDENSLLRKKLIVVRART